MQPSQRGETGGGEVPRGEMVLWVESWVSSCKALTPPPPFLTQKPPFVDR
jgi:hypothetical protein